MNSITPNPLLGVGFHTIGAGLSANCYSPQKYVKRWSWEIFWVTQAAWCWFLWPIIGAWLTIPHLLAMLTGTLWYGQFFFYNLGHVRLGKVYGFSSWAIHMIILVLISNVVAIFFKEWKGCGRRTKTTIGLGLVVLCAAVLMLTYGNYVGEPTPQMK